MESESEFSNEPFTKQMRRATRMVHNISDSLINAKIGIAMSDNRVWAEGLLAFYEIFKHLENVIDKFDCAMLRELDVPGMRRTAAFEKDLCFYLGENWREGYSPQPAVWEYLNYLTILEERKPILLLAYIYHLYMGLLSGGQILKKKRALLMKIPFSKNISMEGLAVVDVKDNAYVMKKELGSAMNRVAETLTDDVRQLLLEESKKVFIMNNKMVQSIKGADEVIKGKMIKMASIAVIIVVISYLIKRLVQSESKV